MAARRTAGQAPPSRLVRDLATSMAPLLVASLMSLTLVNLGPVAIRYVQDVPAAARDGSYLAAAFIARLPIFAFAAVQAVLMPRLARAVVKNDAADFRGPGAPRAWCPRSGLGLPVSPCVAVAGPMAARLLAGPAVRPAKGSTWSCSRLPMPATCSRWCCSRPPWPSDATEPVPWSGSLGRLTFSVAWVLPTDASTAVSVAIAVVSLSVSAGLAAWSGAAYHTRFRSAHGVEHVAVPVRSENRLPVRRDNIAGAPRLEGFRAEEARARGRSDEKDVVAPSWLLASGNRAHRGGPSRLTSEKRMSVDRQNPHCLPVGVDLCAGSWHCHQGGRHLFKWRTAVRGETRASRKPPHSRQS